jgi:hypothetical protein
LAVSLIEKLEGLLKKILNYKNDKHSFKWIHFAPGIIFSYVSHELVLETQMGAMGDAERITDRRPNMHKAGAR